MILQIIKWYSIIFLGLGTLANFWKSIRSRELTDFIAFLCSIPIIIYLILK